MVRFAIILILPLILFSACNDSFKEYEETPSYPTEGKAFFALNLHVPNPGKATRAEYEDGDESEYAMSPDLTDHFAICFDETGDFVSLGEFISMEGEEENANRSVTKTIKSVINIDLPNPGKPRLKYLLLVLNGRNLKSKISAELEEEGKNNIQSLLDADWTGEGEDGYSLLGYNSSTSASDTRYFTMSNSMYVAGNESGYELGGPADISSLLYFSTSTEAQNTTDNTVDVYVDRILAKFSADFEAQKFIKTQSGYIINQESKVRVKTGDSDPEETTWAINFIGMGVNGLEQTTYLYKKLITDGLTSFPALSSTPVFYESWNDPGNCRSYWAIDTNYAGGNYPKQYRKILTPGFDMATLENLTAPSLHYRSWLQLNNGFSNVYSVENTFSGEEIDPTAYLNAATHIIFGAQVLFGNELPNNPSASTTIGNVATKYRDYNGIWYIDETQLKKASLKALTEALSSTDIQMEMPYYRQFTDFPISENDYISVQGNNLHIKKSIKGAKLMINNLDVNQDDFQLTKAYTLHGDGEVILAPNEIEEDGNTNIYLAIPEASGNTLQVTLPANILTSLAYHFSKTVECYTQGLMYYVATIPHHNKTNPSNGTIGDYGVVRNHWYGLNVKNVSTIGTPIHDPEQPIVPQLDTKLVIKWDVAPWTEKEVNIPDFN